MKNKRFKIISTFISLMLVFSSVAVFAEGEKVYENKLTAALQERLETAKDDEKIDVYLWAVDINYDKVESETLKQTGVSQQKIDELSVKMQDGYFEKNEIKNSAAYISGEKSVNLEKWAKDTGEVRKELNEKVDLYISSKRAIAREQYDEVNTKTLKALGVSEKEVIFKSKYSPMIIASLTKPKIEKLAKSGLVALIDEYVELEIAEDEPIDETAKSTEKFVRKMMSGISPMAASPSYMNYHKAAINFDGLPSVLDGYGINVGLLENNYPYQNDPDLPFNNIIFLPGANSESDSHPTRVAKIIKGTEGLAKGIKLYCIAHRNSDDYEHNLVDYDFYEAIEALVSKDVSVINHSAAFKRGHYPSNRTKGYYSIIEKWVDHISMQHHITFVQAADNNPTSDDYVVNVPGLAYNVITVGNFNDNLTLATSDDAMYKSRYGNNDPNTSIVDGCEKPDVIASGCNVYGDSGTSFSTPMVTGVVACLMEMMPTLKLNPVLVKAILIASCDRKVIGESMGTLTAQQGAGVINAGNCASIIGNGRFVFSSTYDALISTNFYCTGSGRKNFAFVYEVRNLGNANHINDNVTVLPYIDYNLTVFDYNSGSTIGTSGFTNSSVELVSKVTSSTRFMVIANGSAVTGYPTSYAFAWHNL